MRKLFLIFGLLMFCAISASAAISRTGSCSASANNCTLSAVNTNDLIVVFAYRSASVTAPSLPASNTSITTQATAAGGTTGSFRVYCRKASSGADTGTGTATNATGIVAVAYSGTAVGTTANCNTTGAFGTNAATSNAKTSTTASYPGITLSVTDGTSWVDGFLGDSASSVCSPTGMSSFSTTGQADGSDTNAAVSSWSTATCAVSSSTWMTYVIEILQLCDSSSKVCFDAKCTGDSTTTGTSINSTTLTIGSGSNRVLVAQVGFSNKAITGLTVTWDSVAMTQILTANGTGTNGRSDLWGLVNPNTGNKTLALSWTGSSDVVVCGVSFNGANQTGGATTFPNTANATGTATASSVTVTTVSGRATVENDVNDGSSQSGPSQTQTYIEGGAPSISAEGQYAMSSSSSTNFTWSSGTTGHWVAVATDIARPSTGTCTNHLLLLGIGAGC